MRASQPDFSEGDPAQSDHGFARPGTGTLFHGPACQEGGVHMTVVAGEGPWPRLSVPRTPVLSRQLGTLRPQGRDS